MQTTFEHKFKLNETVYFKTDHGVNEGLVITLYLTKELSINTGLDYNYLSYGILKNSHQHTVASHNVFATPQEAFK